MSQFPFPALSHTILLKNLTQVKLIFLVFPSTLHFIFLKNQKFNKLSASIFFVLVPFFPSSLNVIHILVILPDATLVTFPPQNRLHLLPQAVILQAVMVHFTQKHILFFNWQDYILFIIVIYVCIFSCQFFHNTRSGCVLHFPLYILQYIKCPTFNKTQQIMISSM